MTKKLLAGLAIALLLGACAAQQGGRSNDRPVVEVAGDAVQRVVPDPLRFRQGKGAVVITWRLSADGYSFPANGITIDGELERPRGQLKSRDQDQVVDCKPTANGRQFQCNYKNSRPGAFKYTVRVLRNGQPLAPFDPEITNME